MKLYPDCGFFSEEQDDPFAPETDCCEDCYRYKICLHAKTKEEAKEYERNC